MKTPAEVFQPNPRKLKSTKAWTYPQGWERKWVKANGEISTNGSRHYVGEAFVRDYVGLKPLRPGVSEVYFGPMLVGELHTQETGAIRMSAQGEHILITAIDLASSFFGRSFGIRIV